MRDIGYPVLRWMGWVTVGLIVIVMGWLLSGLPFAQEGAPPLPRASLNQEQGESPGHNPRFHVEYEVIQQGKKVYVKEGQPLPAGSKATLVITTQDPRLRDVKIEVDSQKYDFQWKGSRGEIRAPVSTLTPTLKAWGMAGPVL